MIKFEMLSDSYKPTFVAQRCAVVTALFITNVRGNSHDAILP